MIRDGIVPVMTLPVALNVGAGIFIMSVVEHAAKVALRWRRRTDGEVVVALPLVAGLALPIAALFFAGLLPRGSRYAGVGTVMP